ncbi:hypothetical protein LEP1GSC013_0238 [Leptospira interrogans serovar Valbuzzi str. Duyster]|nr:hypothetical protein LEP1GSC013_0238 [Leptospira interrogans serovar Valbuzzi str. Duyster]ENO70956.1 hypothetical protein LEP1GSC012_1424 [Leptospira interrogans serovar Valbuzzi str. Valbuzzi]
MKSLFDDLHRIKNPFYKIPFKIKLLSEMPLYDLHSIKNLSYFEWKMTV